jgi:hypothetical protein
MQIKEYQYPNINESKNEFRKSDLKKGKKTNLLRIKTIKPEKIKNKPNLSRVKTKTTIR